MKRLLLVFGGLTLAAVVFAAPARAKPAQTYERCQILCYYSSSGRAINSCLNYCAAKYPTRTAIARPTGAKGSSVPVTRERLHR
jgi:hypothetical protein